MKGSRRRGGWCVLLRFKRLPRTFVSCTEVHGTIRASLFLSLVVEWAGSPPLSFPSIRARVNVSLNQRSSYNEPLRIGNTNTSFFANTSPLTLANARAVEDICPGLCTPVSPSRPFFRTSRKAERRKERKKTKRETKRQRDKEMKREREGERK